MRSQSTKQEKSWHSQTHLICERCCVLVNSSFVKTHCDNLPHVSTSPGLPYLFFKEVQKHINFRSNSSITYIFSDFFIDFNFICLFFTTIWGGAPILFFYQIKKKSFIISHYKDTFSMAFLKKILKILVFYLQH